MARVLVVDDNADVRMALRELLEDISHEVFEAADGVEGIDTALSHRPDVVLLDLAMPRFDGLEVLRRLKASQLTSAIPVIVVTAMGSHSQMLEALSRGACGFIDKPWQPGELESQVNWALQASERRKAGKPLPDGWAPIRGRLLIG
jgi:CheY-like chemotaxis protein